MSNFLDAFRSEHEQAGAIVLSRDKEGRNAEISVEDQFTVAGLTAAEFTMGMIEMKYQRARSYLRAGNFFKFKEELQDISNYALFCIVFETPTVPNGGFAQPIRDAGQRLATEVGLPPQPRPPAEPSIDKGTK